MKILVVGPTDADSFADNVAHALNQLGHEVQLGGPARPQRGPRNVRAAVHRTAEISAALDVRLQSGLVRQAKRFRPQLMVTLDSVLRPATVRAVAATGARTALWFPDHVSNMGKHDMFLAGYDRIYFKNPALVDQLTRIQGLPVAYLPEAANPDWHRPIGEYGVTPTIVVAGNIHPTRAILLDRLLDAGIPLTLFGSPIASWIEAPRLRAMHTGRSVVRAEKAETFRAARAVLNNLHPAEFAGSNCRLFEATGSGAVVLSERRAGMDTLFEPDREVLTFASFDELVGHCRRLLADATFGVGIADAAARRTLAEHTYEQRLTAMLADLSLG